MNDSWDDFENQGFLSRLKQRWQAWRMHRQILAEERLEIRRITAEHKAIHEFEDPELRISGKSVSQPLVEEPSQTREKSPENIVVIRRPEPPKEADEPAKSSGMMSQWRQSAEIWRQVQAERKAIRTEMRSGSAPARATEGEDELTVGGKRHGSDEPDAENRVTFGMMLAVFWDELLRLRIPQWLVAIIPSIVMLSAFVLPTVTDTETRAADHVRGLVADWPQKIAAGEWKEAELYGVRLLGAGTMGIDESFRYFECLSKTKDLPRALTFLRSQENRTPVSDLARFRFRLAERLGNLPAAMQTVGLQNFILLKLRESLTGPLPPEQESRARQILAGAAIVQGNFPEAVRYLEPIANSSPFVASDLLFLKFNMASDDELAQIRASASEMLVNLETRTNAKSWTIVLNVLSKLRLLMILDRETEARRWLGTLTDLSDENRRTAEVELDKLSLIVAVRKRPVQSESLWARVQPLLEQEPDNPTWTRLALRLWANGQTTPGSQMDRWVRSRLESEKPDPAFLREGSTIALLNGRWAEARAFYRKLIETQPGEVAALNNLAGLMYKFQPRDLEESLRLVDQALQIAPTNLVILETRGQILARMGRLDEARQILEKSLPALPREWNLHNTIAQIYDRQGNAANARAHREILKTLPEPKDAADYADLSAFLKDRPKNPPASAPATKKAADLQRARQAVSGKSG